MTQTTNSKMNDTTLTTTTPGANPLRDNHEKETLRKMLNAVTQVVIQANIEGELPDEHLREWGYFLLSVDSVL